MHSVHQTTATFGCGLGTRDSYSREKQTAVRPLTNHKSFLPTQDNPSRPPLIDLLYFTVDFIELFIAHS